MTDDEIIKAYREIMKKRRKASGKTTTYRKPATDAAREKANAYRRRYRKENPERVKRWREGYIMRKAARLMAEQAAAAGDAEQK